jgi:hypothetical protein
MKILIKECFFGICNKLIQDWKFYQNNFLNSGFSRSKKKSKIYCQGDPKVIAQNKTILILNLKEKLRHPVTKFVSYIISRLM